MAKDEEYKAAVEKGNKLLQMMLSNDHNAGQLFNPPQPSAQSAFDSVADLEVYGYEQYDSEEGFSTQRLHKALQALGLNDQMAPDGGKNILIRHKHSQSRLIGGVFFTATEAYFSQVYNHDEGVVIAYDNRTAPHMAMDADDYIYCPLLVHWSDIAFLQYVASNPDPAVQPAPLKYIFRLTIQNAATYSLLKKILAKHAMTQWETWPGTTFNIDSEEGRAILGTPNGSGTAWLLIQHKKQLENKKIEKVTLFYAGNEGDLYRWPSLLFWIV